MMTRRVLLAAFLFLVLQGQYMVPGALPGLSWSSGGPGVFINGVPAFEDISIFGQGFDANTTLAIINQTNPGQFTITNVVVTSSTQIDCRVNDTSSPTPTTESGDLLITRGSSRYGPVENASLVEWVSSLQV